MHDCLIDLPSPWVSVFTDTQVNQLATDAPGIAGEKTILLDMQCNLENSETYFRYVRQVLSANAVQNGSQVSVSYDPSYQDLILHSVAIIRGTNRMERLEQNKLKLIQQEKDLDRYVYNGLWSAILLLEDVRVGDQIDYSYTVRGVNPITGPTFAQTFHMQWLVPLQHERIRILCPPSRELFYKYFGLSGEPRISSTNGLKEYIWRWQKVPALVLDPLLPTWFDPQPKIQITEYKNWNEVAKWASRLYAVEHVFSPELQEKINELKQSSTSSEGKAVAALQFVQDHVRYLGIEFGPHSHQAADPSTVFSRRFGDCKDKAVLLCAIFQAMGFNAKPVLVNSTDRWMVQNWQPSPYAFNHVVVQLELDGKTNWMDPTINYQRGSLQNHYFPNYGAGLVVDPATTELVRIKPVQTGLPLTIVWEHFRFLNSNQVQLSVHSVMHGLDADNSRRFLATMSQTDLDRAYKNDYLSRFPKIEMVQPIKVRDDSDKNVIQTEEIYKIPNIWTPSPDGKYLNCEFYPNDFRGLLRKPVNETRTMPLGLLYPINRRHVTEISLVEPWTIARENKVVQNKAFRFEFQKTNSPKHIVLDYRCTSIRDAIFPSELAGYLKDVETVNLLLDLPISKPIGVGATARTRHLNWAVFTGAGFFSILLLIGAVFLYRHRPSTPPPLPDDADPALQGLGGWLVLVAIGLFARALLVSATILRSSPTYSVESWQWLTTPGTASYDSLWAPLLIFELLGNITIVVASLLLIVFFFQKRRVFPTMFVITIVFHMFFLLIDHALAQMIPSIKATASSNASAGGSFIACIIWGLYFSKSRRVKATFIR